MSWFSALLSLIYITTGSTNPYPQLDESTDPRLVKKVSYSGYSVQLQEVAKKLTEKTGVKIITGYTAQDWRVKERKIHIKLKDLPLGTAVREIARGLDYHVTRSGEKGKWTYRIWQDKRAREREEAARDAYWNNIARELRAAREQVLTEAEQALKITGEDIEKMREENPWLAHLADTDEGRASCLILCGLSPQVKSAFLDGQDVSLDASRLSPDAQKAVAQMNSRTISKMADVNGSDYKTFLSLTKPSKINIYPSDLPDSEGAYCRGLAGHIIIEATVDLTDPQVPEMMRKDLSRGNAQDTSDPVELPIELSASNTESAAVTLANEYPQRINTDSGADPEEIDKKVAQYQTKMTLSSVVASPTPKDTRLLTMVNPAKLKSTSTEDPLGPILKGLSKQSDLSFVMDYYPYQDTPTLPGGKTPLYKVLDSLQTGHYEWTYNNGLVSIRPDTWAFERSYEIPEALMVKWQKVLEKEGCFDVNDMAAICSELTYPQLSHRFTNDNRVEAACFYLYERDYEFLKFYRLLSPNQKAQLKTAEGFVFRQLTPVQWQQFARVLKENNIDDQTNFTQGRITLSVEDDFREHSSSTSPDFHVLTFKGELFGNDQESTEQFVVEIQLPTKAHVQDTMQAREEEARSSADEGKKKVDSQDSE